MAKSEQNNYVLPLAVEIPGIQCSLLVAVLGKRQCSPSLIRELLLNGEKLTANIYSQINSV